MEDQSLRRRTIKTQAGYGAVVKRSRLEHLYQELPNYIKKNRGLATNPAFLKILPRLCTGWIRPSPLAKKGPVMFVATHHKVMTTYFSAVMKLLSIGLHVPFKKQGLESIDTDTRMFLSMHGKIDFDAITPYRGIHIMRDPRDIIVSSYHYHKWTNEDWAHRPDENGLSYLQKLNQADRRTGLFMEIDHFIFIYRDILVNWNTDDPNILEVAFHDLMGAERENLYAQIFTHLGFEGNEHAFGIDLMRLFEAGNRTGNKSGKIIEKSHVRSAKSGQWKTELEQDHIDYIEKELGTVLKKFGY